jgi:alkanesulfonate monooxygenase SsuD/methylene tetrahydromethanopterin reductase-like flavin-dependent oxidoreductase (luciferase family)
MRIGAVFPQTEFGNDPIAIRDYAQAVEAMGFRHILVYDHVLGAGLANRPNWRGPYNSETPFHEPFVFYGYLAGLTRELELVTGVIILPQRQTSLVAKQAAEVDVLSGGRLRLGIGIGWNDVEYEGLNEDFHTRGARSVEQVEVLRALWTQPIVTHHRSRNKPTACAAPDPDLVGRHGGGRFETGGALWGRLVSAGWPRRCPPAECRTPAWLHPRSRKNATVSRYRSPYEP